MKRGRGPIGLDAFAEISKRLGDFAEHLKGALDSDAGEGDERSGQRTFEIKTPKGPLTGVASYSVRFGGKTVEDLVGGKVEPEPVHRPKPRKPAPRDVETVREPLVDMHDEGERIVVTAELPGIAIEDVSVEIQNRTLVIETHGQKRFRSVVTLSADVAPATLATSLRNGILQASLEKSKRAEP